MQLKNDLPIKYYMKSHRLCSTYPDEIDVLYDIIEHVMESNKRKKAWKPEDIKIHPDAIKNVFPDIGDDNLKEKIKTILLALHTNNIISIVDGSMLVTREGLSKLYVI